MISISDYAYTRVYFPKEPYIDDAYADVYKNKTCITKWQYKPFMYTIEELDIDNEYLLKIKELVNLKKPKDTEEPVVIEKNQNFNIHFSIENKIITIHVEYWYKAEDGTQRSQRQYVEIPIKTFNKIIQTIKQIRR